MQTSKKIEGVIFDWAGTVVDYGCFAPLASFMEAFQKKGVDITIEEAREPMGMMKRDHIQAICQMERVRDLWEKRFGGKPSEEDIDALYMEFEPNLMGILTDYCDPIPGALDVIAKLRAKGIKIGSTTGYTAKMMEVVEAEARKKGYAPDSVVNSSEVPKGRPYPYMIWQNAIRLELNDLNCVVKVGDTIADIKEGVNANVWTVGIALGSSVMGLTQAEADTMEQAELADKIETTKKKFYEAGADFAIRDISELPEIIETINGKLGQGQLPNA